MCARDAAGGLVLLTPHYESFCLGIAFLGRTGGVVNKMSSSVTQDPRVDPAVQRHCDDKYRGLGNLSRMAGASYGMESGLRPFYRMLEQHKKRWWCWQTPRCCPAVRRCL